LPPASHPIPVNVRTQQRLFLLAFFIPGMAYLIVVRLIPVLVTLYLSFTEWNMTEQPSPTWIGVENYARLARDGDFLTSLTRTLVFCVVATTIEVILGVAIAVFLARPFPGRNLVRTAFLAPMVLTPAVIGLMWYILYHPTIGPLNWILSLFGSEPVGWLTNPTVAFVSIIITDVWHWTPFVFLLAFAAIQNIPADLYESAEIDGASAWQATRHVTLPLIRDTVLVAVLFRSMDAFEIFAEPFVMTGGGPGTATETLSMHIYRTAFNFFQMGYAGAMVVVSIVILVVLYSVYLRLIRTQVAM
jgi:multiple sugar transport system permease protein